MQIDGVNTDDGVAFASMHRDGSRAATVLPTPPFHCNTTCSLRQLQSPLRSRLPSSSESWLKVPAG